ncbi:signal peptide peptidase SppA [Candidatus Woesearchaeota archaeon]|nr:signal peptide peptidase SppA [Candidatus Woesearchaeota archaeon]
MAATEAFGVGRKIFIASPNRKSGSLKWWLLAAGAVFAFALLVAMVLSVSRLEIGQGSIALIKISGTIASGDDLLIGRAASPDKIIGMVDAAEKDSAVKGILLEINSPGGAPVASEEIMKAVKGAKKPTVALIREVGASGAYWVASASDYIVSSPVSITGSVGVTASYLEFSGLLEKYGVGYERLVAGERKDIGTPFRNLTKEEKAILQDALAKMQGYFLETVKENRKLTDDDAVAKISTALVFLGSEAKELGLVDELGGKKEAEEWLKKQTNLTEISYVTYEKKPLFGLGTLLAEQSATAGSSFGTAIMAAVLGAGELQNFRA